MSLSGRDIAALRTDPQAVRLLTELQRLETSLSDLRLQGGYSFLEADWKLHPHPKQQEFFHTPVLKALFSGAQGSGKSYILISWVVGVATHSHPSIHIPGPVDIWIVALNYKKVDQVLLPILRSLLPKGQEKHWDSQSYRMELQDGGTITFMSAEAGPDKFQSNRLNAIAFDEAPQRGNGVAVYRECLSRFKPGCPLYIRMAATPWEMPRFFRDEFFLGAQSRPEEVRCITVGLADNPYITPDQLAYQARQYVGKEYRARILGEVVDLTGIVFDTLSPVHQVDDFEVPPWWPRFRGIDPTEGRRPWAVSWAAASPAGSLYFYDELEIAGTLDEIASTIKAKQPFSKIEWTAIDPFAAKNDVRSGNPWTTELANLGLHTIKVDRSKRSFNRTMMAQRLGDPARGIDPTCFFFKKGARRTYEAFANHTWQDWGAGYEDRAPKEKEEDDVWKDLVDAAIYLVSLNPQFYDVREYIQREREYEDTLDPLDPVMGY